jgi:hypothetical protein
MYMSDTCLHGSVPTHSDGSSAPCARDPEPLLVPFTLAALATV